MHDPIEELAAELDRIGAHATLDPMRNNMAPCIGCGRAGPHSLVVVGRRTDPTSKRAMGENVQRPLCDRCRSDIVWSSK